MEHSRYANIIQLPKSFHLVPKERKIFHSQKTYRAADLHFSLLCEHDLSLTSIEQEVDCIYSIRPPMITTNNTPVHHIPSKCQRENQNSEKKEISVKKLSSVLLSGFTDTVQYKIQWSQMIYIEVHYWRGIRRFSGRDFPIHQQWCFQEAVMFQASVCIPQCLCNELLHLILPTTPFPILIHFC